jgi:hypothetical protein
MTSISVSPRKVRSRIWMAILLKGWPSTMSPYATQTEQRRVRCNWRAHAQATSERVQPRSGPFPHQQRPQRIPAQLSVLLGIHRARPASGTPTSVRARYSAVQKLRQNCSLRRRRGVVRRAVAQNLPSCSLAGGIVRHADAYPAKRQAQLDVASLW